MGDKGMYAFRLFLIPLSPIPLSPIPLSPIPLSPIPLSSPLRSERSHDALRNSADERTTMEWVTME